MACRRTRHEVLEQLRQHAPVVLPSLLLCDFGNLELEIKQLEAAGIKALHFDVMDGQFVPNITYGMPIVASLRNRTDLIFDVHLMIGHPERYVEQFYEAGADVITVHAEAVEDARPVLTQIRELGAAAGLAIDTPTDVQKIESALPLCDVVLTLSVPAGFGGQAFDPHALDKLRSFRDDSAGNFLREVDGGVNPSTVESCVQAGANLLVVGSAIFKTPDYAASVRRLTDLARAVATA